MASKLEQAAAAIVSDVMPTQAAGAQSPDVQQIIEIVITILTDILENCPQSSANIVKAMKAPTILQRAYVLRAVRNGCDCCGNPHTRRLAGAVHQSILARAAKLTDEEATEVVASARNIDNQLI
jgi:hypothetical protein